MSIYILIALMTGLIMGFLFEKVRAAGKVRLLENELIEARTKLNLQQENKDLLLETEARLEKGLLLGTKGTFSEIVTNLFSETQKKQGELLKMVESADVSTRELLKETRDMQAMLYNNQARGAFGEQLISSMIERMGMIEGVHFKRQFTNDAGQRPDFIFYLPENRYLAMDSKFPFASYARIFEGEGSEREVTSFLKEVRQHLKAMVKREYHVDGASLDFICLLIPNDEIYHFIQRADSGLFIEAMEQGILLCSPALLFPLLNIIRHSIKVFGLTKNSQQIIELLGEFETEWSKHSEEIEKMENALTTATTALSKLTGVRSRAFERLLTKKEKLISIDESPL